MSEASTGVFVLGMHRSGTSAATRAINLLGVPVAVQEELKPASPNNPTGFWEVQRLTELNNRLLNELGGSSLGPPLLDSEWSRAASLEDMRRRARRAFGKAHPTDTWVWKDPRNCVLFPFWRNALDARPVVVLVHREPAEVARSLEARQGLSAAMSFAVWERYMREALAGAEALPVLVAPYRQLLSDPRAWARDVGEFLRAEGLPADSAEGAPRVAEFVESSRRASSPSSEPEFELSDSQRRTVAALEELVGRHERFAPPDLPPETSWTEPLLAERRRADLIRRQMEERLQATRRRARQAKAGRSDATELPKEKPRGGRASRTRGRRSGIRDPRSALRLFPGRRGGSGASGGEGARLPDYLIIGAQKSGTSSLFRYLGESRHVELPTEKEIHFFDNGFDKGVDWYRSHFPPASGGGRRSMTGEASPYYVFHPLAAQRVRETIPEVRLLLLLRNPVERAVSHYYHEVGNGFEELPLAAALDLEEERLAGEAERLVAEPGYSSFNHRHFSYQARGLYADQLELWRSIFPDDQLLVMNSDDLFERPVEEMRRVYDFLGLPGKPGEDLGAYNQRDYPAIPNDVRTRLADRFAPHNARLYELVGRDYGWDAGG